jgi:hypothetical protein
VSQKIKFKKQYKPIRFGDRPDPGTVEGHRAAMAEAAETRAYNRRMKELAVQDAERRVGLLSRVFGFFTSKSRRQWLADTDAIPLRRTFCLPCWYRSVAGVPQV